MKKISVKVRPDHLERLSKVKKPILALVELIWNGLDADAREVKIVFEKDKKLGTLEAIRVTDNGHGISYDDAVPAFENLGGSWKRKSLKSKGEKRLLHGKAGKGRFRAFALGDLVEWYTISRENGKFTAFKIVGSLNKLGTFEISDPVTSKSKSEGTEVRIFNIPKNLPSLFGDSAIQEITEFLALYLSLYPNIKVTYDGKKITPNLAQNFKKDYKIGPIELTDGSKLTAQMTIIEWKNSSDRSLYLCDRNGIPLERTTPGIQAPNFNFTAYLKSDYLANLDQDNLLALEEMHPDLTKLIDATKRKLREHFRERAAELASHVLEGWKSEEIYPYEGEPKDILEKTERQVFDICALNVSSYLPDFDDSSKMNKRLTFNLLKEALNEKPEIVKKIVGDVLELPLEKQEELAKLLEKTTLSAIINASKTVADRLDFLKGLEILVFDPESKERLLERSQLHKIMESETWIFGEEFNLSVSDESLDEVLNKHLEILRKEPSNDKPVKTLDGSTGIVDLMLSRRIPHPNSEKREHIIIELKRPSKSIDDHVTTQIKKYAYAVAVDERFRDTDTVWKFWAVSNDLTESARRDSIQKDRPKGLLFESDDSGITVWVKTWGEIINSCRARLEFFQQRLAYAADKDSAIAYLRETHRKYLPEKLK